MSTFFKYNIKFQIFNLIFLNLLILLFYLLVISELVQGRSIRKRAGHSFRETNSYQLNQRQFSGDNNFINPFDFYNWRATDFGQGKQDLGPVFPILTPSGPDNSANGQEDEIPQTGVGDEIPEVEASGPITRPAEPYLYNFDLIMDFGGIIMRSLTRDLPVAPLVGLSRNIVESEQCAEYVSCGTSKFSMRHDTFNWLHNFLVDFPFNGDLADRVKNGSTRAADKTVKECDFKCNPIGTLTRGLSVLETLQKVVKITNNL